MICLEKKAFYELIEKVIEWFKERYQTKEDKWISADEAVQKLRIASKTTLQKFREEGRIRFSQPDKKIILYDADSSIEYLEKHVK